MCGSTARVVSIFCILEQEVGKERTCSVAQRRTMPSRSDALALLALTKRSRYARVTKLGGSSVICRPYFVAVISKKDISRRILFNADMSRSIVRYRGWNCEFGMAGSRILESNCPIN